MGVEIQSRPLKSPVLTVLVMVGELLAQALLVYVLWVVAPTRLVGEPARHALYPAWAYSIQTALDAHQEL